LPDGDGSAAALKAGHAYGFGASEVVYPEFNASLIISRQLSGQTPANTDVAKIVDHTA
jgi:hypothetical protein